MKTETTRGAATRGSLPSALLRGALLALLALAWGCSDTSLAPMGADEFLPCGTTQDCPAGFTCQSGICAEAGGERLSVALHIVPPSSFPGLAPQFAELNVTLGTSIPDIVVTPPINLFGTVLYDAADPLQRTPPAQAELRFVPVGEWAHLQDTVTVQTFGVPAQWTAELPAGRYDVTVRTDERVPPTRFREVLVNANTDRVFVIPPPDRARPLRGMVVSRDPDSGAEKPVAGVRVQAFSMDRDHISTSALTDEEGRFHLQAPLDASRYRLTVRAESQSDVVIPAVTFETITLTESSRETLFVFDMGVAGTLLEVPVRVLNHAGEPVPNVALTARSGALPTDAGTTAPPTNGVGADLEPIERVRPESSTHSASGTSDEDGLATMALFPQTYVVTAIPLDGEDGATVFERVRITPERAESPVEFRLARRVPFVGRILDSRGEQGISGAQVTLERVSGLGEEGTGLSVASFIVGAQTETEPDGSFEARATPGMYLVDIRPPERRGLARFLYAVDVERAEGEPEVYEFLLPESGVVTGRALAPDGTPIVGAEVTAWVNVAGRNRPWATALTSSEGVYRLLLPSALPDPLPLGE